MKTSQHIDHLLSDYLDDALSPDQQRLVETGRRARAAVNSAGSGGSVIGLARSELHLGQLEAAYHSIGAGWLALS